MFSFPKTMIKKTKETYHRCLYVYNYHLYKDCLDNETRIKYYKKAAYHRKEMKY
ncbi:hypothetical protein H1D32_10480 [Anaerobacillus sp. CMMVII]|uniref:hypothetical protein n=1 Tax=Anaerobacillus sp. CMMVII TaxID=2755588 RepID=UPI0021B76A18|nr:hypothetical protein [Anaerobacillus sp. CMMVII]MCT8138141.1 hypothetical protein [Anaerobacillus sp. CMMVII]